MARRHTLTPNDRAFIMQIAQEVRNERRGCVRGWCLPASIRLADRLRRLGYPARRVWGFLLTDGEFEGEWGGDSPIIWADDDPTVQRDMPHNWVTVDNLLIDITAEQFNRVIRGEQFPPVYLTTIDSASRYIPGDIFESEPDDIASATKAWKYGKK